MVDSDEAGGDRKVTEDGRSRKISELMPGGNGQGGGKKLELFYDGKESLVR